MAWRAMRFTDHDWVAGRYVAKCDKEEVEKRFSLGQHSGSERDRVVAKPCRTTHNGNMPIRVALVSYDINEGRVERYPPLQLCTLATALSKAGHEVKVFDYNGPFAQMSEYFGEIANFGPDVVGLACFTPYVRLFHRVTSELRKAVPDTAMLIGGYHPTVWPEWSLEKMPQFDYALQGECDYTINQFAEMIEGKRAPADVKGLVYRHNGAILKNELDSVTDLNVLPQTDRKYLDRYYSQGFYSYLTEQDKVDMMVTARGCPFACTFCFKMERRYRFRSAESVMEEFDILKSRGVTAVHIMDDAFTANRQRCLRIADALIRGKYGFRLKVRSRVNVVDEELLRKLKECGVRQIVYGLESGSQRVLDCMDKHATVAMNERAVRLTNKVGIFCTGDIMIGMPAETAETIDETIGFLRRNRVIISSVPFLYPLPGTKVYEDAKRSGQLQGDWSVDGPDPWLKLPWTDSVEDLRRECRRVERSVHRNPRSALYFLRHNVGALGSAKLVKKLGRTAMRSIFG
jgi:anaerobic magnesium-protoporphyrin IX monomethyl ester cyclase